MPSKHEDALRGLFEEVGLVDYTPPANPLDQLGISRVLAHELLDVDPSGQSLQLAARGMFRALSGVYHPDTGVANVEKFNEITDANEQLQNSPPDKLLQWSKADAKTKTAPTDDKEKEQLLKNAGHIIERLVIDAENPFYYQNFNESNGLVINTKGKLSLLQPAKSGTFKKIPAVNYGHAMKDYGLKFLDNNDTEATQNVTDLIELEARIKDYDPRAAALVFADSDGDFFVYDKDLEMLSEAGALVNEIVQYIDAYPKEMPEEAEEASRVHWVNYSWAKAKHPRLIVIPADAGTIQVISFDETRFLNPYSKKHREIPPMHFEIIGSTAIRDMIAYRNTLPRRSNAITAPKSENSKLFGQLPLVPFDYADLGKADLGYTPLLLPGNLPIVRNGATGQLSISDSPIVGLFNRSV